MQVPDQLRISDFPDLRYPNSKIAQRSEKKKKMAKTHHAAIKKYELFYLP
jgi:hypothetical protein